VGSYDLGEEGRVSQRQWEEGAGVTVTVLEGDVREVLRTLADESVNCVVTSPPYWGLRDYNVSGQLGLEPSLHEHVTAMVEVFREVKRVLRKDGVCWVNYGDSYATQPNGRSADDTKAAGNDDRTFRDKPFSTVGPVGGTRVTAGSNREDVDVGGWGSSDASLRWRGGGVLKAKDLCMVPFRFALAMQDDGWWLRSVMPWVKRNGMPESITDRPATSVEYVFMFTRSARYWYDATAVRREMAETSVARLSQDVESQTDSTRANAGRKTNGNMKAVGDKQGLGSRRYAGFNARWDEKEKAARSRGVPPRHAQYESSDQSGLDEVERGSRNFRNSDLFFESLEGPHGLVTNEFGDPLALDVPPQPFREAHFATFPPKLIEPLIKAGCPAGGMILDPFGGAGTSGLVADRLGRHATLIELNPEYAGLARSRIRGDAGMFADVT
jgi:DNA modification methylase